METKTLHIHWPIVINISIILYLLTIVLLPFSSTASTFFLLLLIGYWSRVPGVGIPTPFFALYLADFIDLFSLLIAINLNPAAGAFFAFFGNIGSRIAGVTPGWGGSLKDTFMQVILCLFAPLLHSLTGGNILYTMMAYTVLRRLGFIPLWFLFPHIPFPRFIITWPGATAVSFIINSFYAYFFGGFFDNILQEGMKFNGVLFSAATIVMIISKLYRLSAKAEKKISDRVERRLSELFLRIFRSKKNLNNIRRLLEFIEI